MKIIKTPPPNWADIQKLFPVKWEDQVIVTYYPNVYCVTGHISQFKLVHEGVHLEQQKRMGVQQWWTRYFNDPKFRLDQEVEAYRAEAKYLRDNPHLTVRDQRRSYLRQIVEQLSSEMYGRLVTKAQAEKLIK